MATVRMQIGPTDRGRRLTLAEFQDSEWRPGYLYELARGVVVVTRIPNGRHWQVVHNTHELFSIYLRDHPGLIRRIGHGSDARYISPAFQSDRHPDIAILFRQAPTDHEGTPLPVLGVEVVSRGKRVRRRDYEEKREEYLAIGLQRILDRRSRGAARDGPGPPRGRRRRDLGRAPLPGRRLSSPASRCPGSQGRWPTSGPTSTRTADGWRSPRGPLVR